MLGANSQFKERAALSARTSTSEPLEIPLADDDPKALGVILRVIHLQYDWVPPSLDESQLYKIAVICDKYDMRQPLELWLVRWISPFVESPDGPVSGDKWLFIAYAFARKDLFSRLTKDLILQCQSDEDGNLLLNGNTLCEHIPEHIVAEISARRHQTIEAMIECIHSTIEAYGAPNTSKCTSGRNPCDDLALGFLIRTFKRLKIYPEASQILLQSIQEFNTLLDGVSFPSNVLIINNLGGRRLHAATCSPLLGYQGKTVTLVNSIKGLSYSDFIRVSTPAKESTTAPPPGANLWNCFGFN